MMQRPVVLITGAKSGIGRATALLLASEGFEVFGTSREPGHEVPGVTMLQLDVRSEVSVKQCVDNVLARTGRVDVLINNANVAQMGAAEEMTLATAVDILETDYLGAVRMARAVLPAMRAQRAGRIIGLTSVGGGLGIPFHAFYCAAKHALEGFSESLRHEVLPLGIFVTLVSPGVVKTLAAREFPTAPLHLADYPERSAVVRAFAERMEKGDPPQRVAAALLRVIRTARPKLYCRTSPMSFWLPRLKHVLPYRMYEWFIRRALQAGFGMRRVSLWGAALVGLFLVAIGLNGIIRPALGAAAFGVELIDLRDGLYFQVKAARDLSMGLGVLALLASRMHRALGILLLCGALIPGLDCALGLLAQRGSAPYFLAVHGGAALLVGVVGFGLVRSTVARAGSV